VKKRIIGGFALRKIVPVSAHRVWQDDLWRRSQLNGPVALFATRPNFLHPAFLAIFAKPLALLGVLVQTRFLLDRKCRTALPYRPSETVCDGTDAHTPAKLKYSRSRPALRSPSSRLKASSSKSFFQRPRHAKPSWKNLAKQVDGALTSRSFDPALNCALGPVDKEL